MSTDDQKEKAERRRLFEKYAPGLIEKIRASKVVYTEESPEYQMLMFLGYEDLAKSRKKTFGHSGVKKDDGNYTDTEDN